MWRKFLILLVIFSTNSSGNRVKRHLVFNKGSRFFVTLIFKQTMLGSSERLQIVYSQPSIAFSVDVRDNLFEVSDLFANVFGFKIDWDLPSSIIQEPKRSHIQRRDLYQGIEKFLYQHDINGTSCVRKFLCEASNILPSRELFLAQLYELVFATREAEILNTYNIKDIKRDCISILKLKPEQNCPFSLLSFMYGSAFSFRPKLS